MGGGGASSLPAWLGGACGVGWSHRHGGGLLPAMCPVLQTQREVVFNLVQQLPRNADPSRAAHPT